MKRGFIILGIVTLIPGLLGCDHFTDNNLEFSGSYSGMSADDSITWSIDKNTKTLTISGHGAMSDDRSPWFYADSPYNKYINNIVVEEGITRIGDAAFYGMYDATGTISFPSTLKEIAGFAFNGGLFSGEIKLPEGLEYIGDNAFWNCKNLTGPLYIPDSVTYIGDEAFHQCESLSGELHLPKNLTHIGRAAFARDKGFTGDIIIPEGVESIGAYAFSECEGFNGVISLPENITELPDNVFYGCSLKGDLIIPANVEKIGYSAFSSNAFDGKLVLNSGLQSIESYSFFNNSFSEIEFPDSIEYIGSSAFVNNKSLKKINKLPDNLRFLDDNVFAGCSNLVGDFIIPDNVSFINYGVFNDVKFDKVIIPAATEYVDYNSFSSDTDVIFSGANLFDTKYKVVKNGKAPEGTGNINDGSSDSSTDDNGAQKDEPYVWDQFGEDYRGFGPFSYMMFKFTEDGNINIYQYEKAEYGDEKVLLDTIPFHVMNSDTYDNMEIDAAVEFKINDYSFKHFVFDQMNYRTCTATVLSPDGKEMEYVFGDWTDSVYEKWLLNEGRFLND